MRDGYTGSWIGEKSNTGDEDPIPGESARPGSSDRMGGPPLG